MSYAKSYRFEVQGEEVTGILEVKSDEIEVERIEKGEIWLVDGKDVIKKEFDDGRWEITRYVDSDGDGLFQKASKIYEFKSPVPTNGFSFSISDDDSVEGVFEIRSGKERKVEFEPAEFYIDEGNLIQIIDTGKQTTKVVYADDDGDGIFSITESSRISGVPAFAASEDITPSGEVALQQREGYRFQIFNGAVVGMTEIERGRSKPEEIDENEVWTVSSNIITKSEMEHGIVEVTTYQDLNGDGIYVESSKTVTRADGSVSSLAEIGDGSDDKWEGDKFDDYYFASSGNDRLNGRDGDDELYGADGDDRLTGGKGSDDLYGGDGNDVISGDSGNDYLYGADGNDTVNGGVGDDVIVGGSGRGNDVYIGGSGVDTITYSSAEFGVSVSLAKKRAQSIDGSQDTAAIGSDKISGVENVVGGSYDDLITGDKKINVIRGEGGDDTISGGLGADTLFGGLGNDTFVYRSAKDSGLKAKYLDVLADFSEGDFIDLSAIDAMKGVRGDQAFVMLGSPDQLSKETANGALWYQDGILFGSTDRDIAAEFAISVDLNGFDLGAPQNFLIA